MRWHFRRETKLVHHGVQLGGLLPLAGDNQRGAGLVDEDGVHLVHDGKGVAPLNQLLLVDGHVVPQVVKAELVVGAVGDVGGIGGLFRVAHHAVNDQAHRQPHKAVDFAHPLAVALGQVVVDGDDVDSPARQGVEVGGQSGYQRFSFAGFHLGNAALVEHDAAHHLDPVGAHAQHAPGGLPAGGKGLGQDVVQGLAVLQALLKLRGLGLELGVGQGLVFLLQGIHLVRNGVDGLQLPLGGSAEDLGQQTHSKKHLSVADLHQWTQYHSLIIILVSIPQSPRRKKSKL